MIKVKFKFFGGGWGKRGEKKKGEGEKKRRDVANFSSLFCQKSALHSQRGTFIIINLSHHATGGSSGREKKKEEGGGSDFGTKLQLCTVQTPNLSSLPSLLVHFLFYFVIWEAKEGGGKKRGEGGRTFSSLSHWTSSPRASI